MPLPPQSHDIHAPSAETADPTAAPGVPRKEVYAWVLYDWANSAYSTLSITFLVFYIKEVVYQNPVNVLGISVTGSRVWGWGIGTSMFCAAALSPVFGAIADAHASKRRWLAVTALSGAVAALGLAAVSPAWWWAVAPLFFLASFCFELSLGFYNAFLPEISDEQSMNRISALGFALGYIGGGLALAAAMCLKFPADALGWSGATQLRVGLAVMGLWWGGFTIPTLVILKERATPIAEPMPLWRAGRKALREVKTTVGNIRRFKMLSLFLVGFLLYNEGIQTVMSQASVFALEVLSMPATELVAVVLLIQFAALPGALLVGRLSDRIGQKPALLLTLAAWMVVLVEAYFVTTRAEFWVLAGVVALVMGGTQSVSRAMMGTMTPQQHSGEFFGFFNLSGKATSMVGPILFTEVMEQSGSPHLAILSLLGFIVLGTALVGGVNVARGREQALSAE